MNFFDLYKSFSAIFMHYKYHSDNTFWGSKYLVDDVQLLVCRDTCRRVDNLYGLYERTLYVTRSSYLCMWPSNSTVTTAPLKAHIMRYWLEILQDILPLCDRLRFKDNTRIILWTGILHWIKQNNSAICIEYQKFVDPALEDDHVFLQFCDFINAYFQNKTGQ